MCASLLSRVLSMLLLNCGHDKHVSMDQLNSVYFELIRVALGKQANLSHLPSACEWDKLYKIAKKQSSLGICFAGLQNLGANADEGYARIGIPKDVYFQWMGMAVQIQQRNEVVNKQCVNLQAKLFTDGFTSCVLKGQGVAQLYGEQLCSLRQSGDIDLWVNASRDTIVKYVMDIAPTRDVNFQHVHFNVLNDTAIELHIVPVSRYNPKRNWILKKYFNSEVDRQCANRQMIGGYEMSVPTVDFQLVHQLLHVYGHYVYEGVGVRQFMDLYFAQEACADVPEYFEMIRTLFKKLGLMKFVAATQYVLRVIFQMPLEQLICEPDENEGEQILAIVMDGGNFGYYRKKMQMKGESLITRMWRRFMQSVHMIRFDLLGVLCGPWYRIYIEFWRRMIGKKYGV